MRNAIVKILIVIVILGILSTATSGFTNPVVLMAGDERRCPACVKQAREHKNRDLVYSTIDPWQTVDNKVVYY